MILLPKMLGVGESVVYGDEMLFVPYRVDRWVLALPVSKNGIVHNFVWVLPSGNVIFETI